MTNQDSKKLISDISSLFSNVLKLGFSTYKEPVDTSVDVVFLAYDFIPDIVMNKLYIEFLYNLPMNLRLDLAHKDNYHIIESAAEIATNKFFSENPLDVEDEHFRNGLYEAIVER